MPALVPPETKMVGGKVIKKVRENIQEKAPEAVAITEAFKEAMSKIYALV